jgi:hypothetical protein
MSLNDCPNCQQPRGFVMLPNGLRECPYCGSVFWSGDHSVEFAKYDRLECLYVSPTLLWDGVSGEKMLITDLDQLGYL